jgi:hypothetical protein
MNQYTLEHALANALEAVGEARSDETLKVAAQMMRASIAARVEQDMEARREFEKKRREIEREFGR